MSRQLLFKARCFEAILVAALIVCGFGWPSVAIAEVGVLSQPVAAKDEQAFMGRWIRPDGGYILELSKGREEGALSAAYYNPRPIHVARAEFTRSNGTFTIEVELRDINYPGSTYTLKYDPESDRLIGTYFQAVEKVTYDITFVRTK